MPRQPNTLPTTIYWLVDTRPETIANGWSNGYPFYCGKTIFSAEKRLVEHYATAVKHPHRAIAAWIRGCGKHICVQIMETVPTDKDWAERERYWIATLRLLWPLCANTTNGGQGALGLVHPRESVERRAAKHRGLKRTPETRAKIGAASKGRKHSAESKARRACRSGHKWTPERHERAMAALAARKAKKIAKRQHRAEVRARRDQRRQDRINMKLKSINAVLPEISLIC
jgi:hypothetical protein